MGLHINNLPDSLLLKILSYLEQVELHLSVSRVCKRWNNICYDRDLWRKFSQLEYEQSFNGSLNKRLYIMTVEEYKQSFLVDTRGFQCYILQRVHQYITCLSLSPSGLIFLPLLNKLGFPNLQRLNLPYPDYMDYTAVQLVSIQNIQESTGAKIFLLNRPWEPENNLSDRNSIELLMSDGGDELTELLTTDWRQVVTSLQENPSISFVSLHCGRRVEDKAIPAETFRQLAKIKPQHLYLSNCSLERLNQLRKAEISSLCKNLLSLKLYPFHTTTECLDNLLSHAESVRHLRLGFEALSALPVVSCTCKKLSELHMYANSMTIDVPRLWDIGLHCEKLQTVSIRGPGDISIGSTQLDTFLLTLATHCKELKHLHLQKCHETDASQETTKNGLADLLNSCQKLKTLEVTPAKTWGSFDFNPLKGLNGSLPLEVLVFGHVKAGFWKPPSETVGKMCNLTKLSLYMVEEEYISLEFMEELNKTCNKLSYLKVQEHCRAIFTLDEDEVDRGPVFLEYIFLTRLRHLALCLQCSYFPTDQIVRLIERSECLERLRLTPVDRDTIPIIRSMMSNRPYVSDSACSDLDLRMLSGRRWKQLNAPTWKDTW